jgi:biotin operon repressor
LGVSDKAVEKHIKKLGLTKPPRGYWMKMVAAVGIEP